MAGQGQSKALGRSMRRGIILKQRLGIKRKNRGRCKEEERKNGRRSGTKAITSSAALTDKPWPLTYMSCATELQMGRARRPPP